MKLIDKPWRYGTYAAYDDIEPEFLPTTKGVRVLPAPFFYDKKLYFELKAIFAPGEHKSFPNGGYEVVDVSGGVRSYDLDQVIIHPAILKHKKMIEKMARKAEKNEKKRAQNMKKFARENKPKRERKGRPPLDPAVKVHRDQLKAAANDRSGGKRGRPKSLLPKQEIVKPVGGGKRGRPPLSLEAIEKKQAAKVARQARSGGRKGRPSSRRILS